VPREESKPIDACIGDLDMKSPEGGKADYWKALERSLIDGGWYTGTEEDLQPDQTWCVSP
jgi:inositol-pentakisphosphate 2-kinase